MPSVKVDLITFVEAQSSIFCYFHNFSKLYVTFRKFNNMWLSYRTTLQKCILIAFYWYHFQYSKDIGSWDMSEFVWCTCSFFDDLSLIYEDLSNIHTTKIAVYMVKEYLS